MEEVLVHVELEEAFLILLVLGGVGDYYGHGLILTVILIVEEEAPVIGAFHVVQDAV